SIGIKFQYAKSFSNASQRVQSVLFTEQKGILRRGVKRLVKAIPALASLPFRAIDPVGTVGTPSGCCQGEDNQCYKQEEDGYHDLLLSKRRLMRATTRNATGGQYTNRPDTSPGDENIYFLSRS